ncbi:MAG: shikimate kinase [Deltaproteobacteria bacterium]|nr:shikimate kinase [Deltaproteobacteria bacterium]
MNLIFIHGLPGVGKLTVARELSGLTNYRLFHNHLTVDLVGSVFEFGTPSFIALRESIWLSVFSEAARDAIPGLVFTFAFEPTVTTGFISNTVETVENQNGKVLFVQLTCGQEQLEQRVVDSSRKAFGKITSLSLLREMQEDGRLSTPSLPYENLIIDTTDLPPAETATQICKSFKIG